MNQENFIRKGHLIISVIIVIPASFIYGFNPASIFDIHLNTVDELNIFKAIMGLYLGFSALWILGLFRRKYLYTALITNAIFMLGLGFGRLVSILVDGIPTLVYVFGTFGELILGFYGVWIIKRNNN